MAYRELHSLELDDEDKYDLAKGMPDDYESPDFPPGCCFTLSKAELTEAGCDPEDLRPGYELMFSAMAKVTSVYEDEDDCRIELEIEQFAGPDGKFFDIEEPEGAPFYCAPSICLKRSQLERLGLDCDCERDDTLHLIGQCCVKSCSSSEYGGDCCQLQITHATAEDESEESRTGG